MSKPKPFYSLCAVLMALCLGLSAVPAMAQSQATTGQIAGAVVDNQGAAITGATVKAINTQTGLTQSVTRLRRDHGGQRRSNGGPNH